MLPAMLQRNGDKMAPGLKTRRAGIPRKENRDALLEAKDRTIAELKERVALLRSELKRKDAIISRIAEEIGEVPPEPAPEAADGPRTVAPGEVRGNQARGDQEEERAGPGRLRLPNGYRVLAIASDAWVLVAPRGLRVSGYRGELDLRQVALDAREHHQRA